MVFVLDSPKKWIETAFTESVSTRRLPWLAEDTFADRTDQMFIRLINKVYKDTHRLSVQNTFTHANCTIVFKLKFRMFYIIYFITLRGFFFTFIGVFGSELILYFRHMTGEWPYYKSVTRPGESDTAHWSRLIGLHPVFWKQDQWFPKGSEACSE